MIFDFFYIFFYFGNDFFITILIIKLFFCIFQIFFYLFGFKISTKFFVDCSILER